MNRPLVAVIGVTALLLLSGCSAVLNPSPEFETTVEPTTDQVAIGESYNVTLAVENTGGSDGAHTVTATIAGNTQTEPITLKPGETGTVTFSHTFTEPGTYSVSTGDNQTTTVTVIDPLRQALENETSYATSGELSVTDETMADEERTTWEARYTAGGDAMNATIIHAGDGVGNSAYTTRVWTKDGTKFIETQDPTFNRTEYSAYDHLYDENARFVSPRPILEQFGGEPDAVTDTDYVYTATPNTTDEREAVMSAVGGEFAYQFPTATNLENLSVEVRIDKDTTNLSTITLDTYSTTSWQSQRMHLSVDYHSYGEPVTVTVPDAVRENIAPAEVSIYETDSSVSVTAYSLRFADEVVVTVNGAEQARLQSEYDSTELITLEEGDTITTYAIVDGERRELETHTVGESDSDW